MAPGSGPRAAALVALGLASVAAVWVDGAGARAALLAAGCRTASWWAPLDPAALREHLAAFPWTSAAMVAMCVPPAAARGGAPAWRALRRVLAMGAAMPLACALAVLAVRIASPQAGTIVYGSTMVVAGMGLGHALDLLARCALAASRSASATRIQRRAASHHG
jgi:hypothetical protein